jgi:hypothetical protein
MIPPTTTTTRRADNGEFLQPRATNEEHLSSHRFHFAVLLQLRTGTGTYCRSFGKDHGFGSLGLRGGCLLKLDTDLRGWIKTDVDGRHGQVLQSSHKQQGVQTATVTVSRRCTI